MAVYRSVISLKSNQNKWVNTIILKSLSLQCFQWTKQKKIIIDTYQSNWLNAYMIYTEIIFLHVENIQECCFYNKKKISLQIHNSTIRSHFIFFNVHFLLLNLILHQTSLSLIDIEHYHTLSDFSDYQSLLFIIIQSNNIRFAYKQKTSIPINVHAWRTRHTDTNTQGIYCSFIHALTTWIIIIYITISMEKILFQFKLQQLFLFYTLYWHRTQHLIQLL